MRQIKFRGMTRRGQLVYGDLIHEFAGSVRIQTADGDNYYVDAESVAQLVGFDNRGEEVYEGDVLIDEYEQEHIAEISDRPRFIQRKVLKGEKQ